MFCPKCGARAQDDARFCASCGFDLGDAKIATNEGAKVATDEGAKVATDEGAKVATDEGAQVRAHATSNSVSHDTSLNTSQEPGNAEDSSADKVRSGSFKSVLDKARGFTPQNLKDVTPWLQHDARYLCFIFVPAILLFALLYFAVTLSGGGSSGPAFLLHLLDPRIILVLVSLGFGGSIAVSGNGDLSGLLSGSGSTTSATSATSGFDALLGGLTGGLSKPSISGEVAFSLFLLVGCIASALAIIYAVRFCKDMRTCSTETRVIRGIITGFAGASLYSLVEFILPFTLSVSGAVSLSITGLGLKTFISMWFWISCTVLVAEALRQGKREYGRVGLYLRNTCAQHPFIRDGWQSMLSIAGNAVLCGVIGVLVFIVVAIYTGLSGSFASIVYQIPIILLIILLYISTPIPLMLEGILIGGTLNVSSIKSPQGIAEMAGNFATDKSSSSSAFNQDLSIVPLLPQLGVLVLLVLLIYVVFVLPLAITRHRTLQRTRLDAKESGRFVAIVAGMWLLISWYTGSFLSVSAGSSLLGVMGSGGLSLTWAVVLAGGVFAVLCELVAVYVVPRLPFLERFERSLFVGVLSGSFTRSDTVKPGEQVGVPTADVVPGEPSTKPVQLAVPRCDEFTDQNSIPSAGPQTSQQQVSRDVENSPQVFPQNTTGEFRPVLDQINQRPKKAPNTMLRRRLAISIGGAAVLIMALVVAYNVLSMTVFSPKSQVERYYEAIAMGDIAAASEVSDPNLDSHARSMLVQGTLDDENNRIKEVSVGNLDKGSISVSYRLDGIQQQVSVPMQQDGMSFLVFKKYKMAAPAVTMLPLGPSAYGGKVLVNGVEVNTEPKSDDDQGIDLPLYPGIYTVSLPQSEYATHNDIPVKVSDKVQTAVTPNDKGRYDFSVEFTKKLDERVRNMLKSHLEACMATGLPKPPNAPFESGWTGGKFLSWTRIDTMPTIVSFANSTAQTREKRRILSDGAVYYGTTNGGSVAYQYQVFGSPSEDTSRINQLDIYVKISADQVTLENEAGTVLYGLDNVTISQQGSDAPPSSSLSSVEPKSAMADYSWDEIVWIAQQIEQSTASGDALAKKYNLVDESGSPINSAKSLELSDGSDLTVQLLGVGQDNTSTPSGKAGLSFVTLECIDQHPMNTTESNKGGWRDSDMRAWLNSDVLNQLPDELQDSIVAVTKKTNDVGRSQESSSVKNTSDKLWLLSWREMFGAISWNRAADTSYIDTILNAEGSQYRYFKDQGLADAQDSDTKGVLIRHLLKDPTGPIESWWTRSSTPNRTDGFGDVNNGGIDNGGLATISQGVVFGFCL